LLNWSAGNALGFGTVALGADFFHSVGIAIEALAAILLVARGASATDR
jgi:hypothetical protein